MPLPKTPKGEKPSVTIAWQSRQMIQMENTISDLRATIENMLDELVQKTNKIAESNNIQSEIEHELFQVKEAAQKQRETFYQKEKELMADRQRLAFLEGFYEGLNRCDTLAMRKE